jgi:phosphoribosylformimino-5-aminoimidazole carboxamide ribotide isomerase
MLIIPAIDLYDGKCVRLKKGRQEDITVYSDSPAQMAAKWVALGAKRLHIVDLNGAFKGSPENHGVIEAIVSSCGVPVQVGGGIRTVDTAKRYISLGASYLIVGTKVITDPSLIETFCKRFPGKIIPSLDCKGDQLATDGWVATSSIPIKNIISRLERYGVKSIIYTNIERDGTLEGLDIGAIKRFLRFTKTPVIIAGGVSNIKDIENLKAISNLGIEGVIVGKAIYERRLNLEEALKLC